MTNSEFYDLTYELKWETADADVAGELNDPLTKFTIWMDDVDGTMYLIVSGRLNAKGVWTLRCRKGRHKWDTHPVSNTVSEITPQAINDIIEDWFESNKDTKGIQFDDEDGEYGW